MTMMFPTNKLNLSSKYGTNRSLPKISENSLKVNNDGFLSLGTQFSINSLNGSVKADALTIKNIYCANKLTINNGVITLNSDGSIISTFPTNNYIPSDSSFNTTTTSVSGLEPQFNSYTAKYLTTQDYVDQQIWKQTKRINTILGTDDQILQNFNNVYKLITAIEGSSETVTVLNNVSTNYQNLVDQSSEIVTSVSNVVAQAQNTIVVSCSPGVWKDGAQPYPIPPPITSLTIADGWYFTNFVANSKINWYLPSDGLNMLIKDVELLWMDVFATSNKILPIISIYTQPKYNGTDISSLANARINFHFTELTNISTAANKHYCLYTNHKPMHIYNMTPLKCAYTYTTNGINTQNNGLGIYNTGSTIETNICALTDKIAFFSIQTDVTAQQNEVEFILSSLNVQLNKGTTKFLFQNSSAAVNYLFQLSYQKNMDLTPNSDAQLVLNGNNNSAFYIYNSLYNH